MKIPFRCLFLFFLIAHNHSFTQAPASSKALPFSLFYPSNPKHFPARLKILTDLVCEARIDRAEFGFQKGPYIALGQEFHFLGFRAQGGAEFLKPPHLSGLSPSRALYRIQGMAAYSLQTKGALLAGVGMSHESAGASQGLKSDPKNSKTFLYDEEHRQSQYNDFFSEFHLPLPAYKAHLILFSRQRRLFLSKNTPEIIESKFSSGWRFEGGIDAHLSSSGALTWKLGLLYDRTLKGRDKLNTQKVNLDSSEGHIPGKFPIIAPTQLWIATLEGAWNFNSYLLGAVFRFQSGHPFGFIDSRLEEQKWLSGLFLKF